MSRPPDEILKAQSGAWLVHVGYFSSDGSAPEFDPGLDVPCPVCALPLRAQPRKTVSLAVSGARSLFFRAHASCWNVATTEIKSAIESQVIDCEAGKAQ